MRTQNSFYVHLPVAAIVLALSAWLRLEIWRWVALVICIAMVLAFELLNTAIESLVARLHPEHNPIIGRALDSAAAAVLIASLGAVVVGLLVIGPPLLAKLGILGGLG
jgi:diacylglycerol kinase